MISKNVVQQLIDQWLEDKDYFLADLAINGDKILVEIDHAEGVWIEDCVALSRHIEQGLDRASQVEWMSYMFCGCSALTSLDVSHFDTSQVDGMNGLFEGCSSLTALDLSNFDTSMLGEMNSMFSDCTALTTLDLSNFDPSWVDYMYQMFCGCNSLTTIYCNSTWNCEMSHSMFAGCTSLRGAVPYDESKTDASMANPETGYFTSRR